jgi:putative tryptophan/tyrosine transport system substrate-binding protein
LADTDRLRRSAAELVALAPDVVLAGGNLALVAFQQASGTLPIVFANVTDPVGVGSFGKRSPAPDSCYVSFTRTDLTSSGMRLRSY